MKLVDLLVCPEIFSNRALVTFFALNPTAQNIWSEI